jgi:hypothetical protein
MTVERIMADSFLVKAHNLRVFRLRRLNGATILCLSRERALRCLQEIHYEELRAKQGR